MPRGYDGHSTQPIADDFDGLNEIDVCGRCSNQERILIGNDKPDNEFNRVAFGEYLRQQATQSSWDSSKFAC
jgi:hypothetical protein